MNYDASSFEKKKRNKLFLQEKLGLRPDPDAPLAVMVSRFAAHKGFDLVEAALDDTNLRRLVAFIDSLRDTTQLIMITHQRRSMEMADVLFGVSMQADGVTKVLSQKLERALENAE